MTDALQSVSLVILAGAFVLQARTLRRMIALVHGLASTLALMAQAQAVLHKQRDSDNA